MSINNFRNVILPFLQGVRFNIFSSTPKITESKKESKDQESIQSSTTTLSVGPCVEIWATVCIFGKVILFDFQLENLCSFRKIDVANIRTYMW